MNAQKIINKSNIPDFKMRFYPEIARTKAIKLEYELEREKNKRCSGGSSKTEYIYIPTPLTKVNEYDVNGDGLLNSADKDYMIACMNGLGSCEGADIDGNGGVEPTDLAMLINQLNNIYSS